MLGAQVVEHAVLEELQAQRVGVEHVHDVLGCRRRVRVAERDKRVVLGPGQQPEGGGQHEDAGALGADEGAGRVEALLGQQVVEVVAGHPPRDV
ncbi:MAG TPA: hypothetical protein VFJ12_14405, partial [Segeticoccus sp.]|nr:hypothetical protein [Segeticoccus sp.]